MAPIEHGATDAATTETERQVRRAGRAERTVLCLGLVAAWTYGCFVFLYRETVLGMRMGAAVTLCLFLLGTAALVIATGWRPIRHLLSPGTMLNLGLALLVSCATVLAADTAYSVYVNILRAPNRAAVSTAVREADPHVWHGELMAREYHLPGGQLRLYKPNSLTVADTYGQFYVSAMLGSPTLADSVLELRHLSYGIGSQGLRDTTALTDSRVFALGDSFVFGYATDQDRIWTSLLGAALGTHVYNLGIADTGPTAQLLLLEHLLRTQKDSLHVDQLLWMIFEGNDLENESGPSQPAPGRSADWPIDGTMLQALLSLPGRMNSQSILRKALHGELTATLRTVTAARDSHYLVDGVRLSYPLYHSKQWGYRLFNWRTVERATRPLSYVLEHPGRPRLDRAFAEMRELSEAHGFDVLVIAVPSAARLYGAAFDEFPQPTAEPYFADYVISLARREGFATADLVRGMQPFAASELLYYRDDTHWNARGNEVAAQLIMAALRPDESPH